MYSSVPTSTHSLSKKWKQLIKFYLDLFSMDESKEPDLCNIRGQARDNNNNISLFWQRLYISFRLL